MQDEGAFVVPPAFIDLSSSNKVNLGLCANGHNRLSYDQKDPYESNVPIIGNWSGNLRFTYCLTPYGNSLKGIPKDILQVRVNFVNYTKFRYHSILSQTCSFD